MRNAEKIVIFSFLILPLLNSETLGIDSPCGGWESYKDEKCFKIFENIPLQTFENARETCQHQDDTSSLVHIHSQEEQDFFSNFLFKIHNVVDTVWIGAKYKTTNFKWVDDSEIIFNNWAEGNPRNITGNSCVQIAPDVPLTGKWVNEPCNKKNLVVCQKIQKWSLVRLQKTLLDSRKELRDSLESAKMQLNDQKTKISNMEHNPVPVGFIYVQLPDQPSPTSLWPAVVWTEVSSKYAGLFFRVVGGNSAAFEQIQNENSPRLTQVEWHTFPEKNYLRTDVPAGEWSNLVRTGNIPAGKPDSIRFLVSGGEVRPRNQAYRIWKRTK